MDIGQLTHILWAQVISILAQATDRLVARQPRWSPALPCASTIPWICQNCSYFSELVEFANKKIKWSVEILFTNFTLPNWQNIGLHILVSKKRPIRSRDHLTITLLQASFVHGLVTLLNANDQVFLDPYLGVACGEELARWIYTQITNHPLGLIKSVRGPI